MSRSICTFILVLGVACFVAGPQTANAAAVTLITHAGNTDPTLENWVKVDNGIGSTGSAATTDTTSEACWALWVPDATNNSRYVPSSSIMAMDDMPAIRAGGYVADVKFQDRNGQTVSDDSQVMHVDDGTNVYQIQLFGAAHGGKDVQAITLNGTGGGTFYATDTQNWVAKTVEIRVAPGASTADVYLGGTEVATGWAGVPSTAGGDPFAFGWGGNISSSPKTTFYVSASFTALNQVPEPNSIVLFVTGLIGLLAYAWRKGR
jgi:hypothetical protein